MHEKGEDRSGRRVGALAVVLVATGVVGYGLIIVAVACTVMMAMMMGGMSHGDGHTGPDR